MNQEITQRMISDFYNCFDTGYDFEVFLKKFLEDLNFSDIRVTKRSGDNGIDLIAYKNSIVDLDIDPEKYIIQAKRYKNKIPVNEIREFKGTASYEKRIFITTSDFSKSGIEEAENDKLRKITLVNGENILKYYMNHPEKDYVFEWNPKVSEEKVKSIVNNEKSDNSINSFREDAILRLISSNDIKAKILPIPVEIFEKIKQYEKYIVVINKKEKELNINHERRYFGGVTGIYKDIGYYGYRGIDKKKSYWKLDERENKIYIEFV